MAPRRSIERSDSDIKININIGAAADQMAPAQGISQSHLRGTRLAVVKLAGEEPSRQKLSATAAARTPWQPSQASILLR